MYVANGLTLVFCFIAIAQKDCMHLLIFNKTFFFHQLHAVSRIQQGKQRESSVKTRRFLLSRVFVALRVNWWSSRPRSCLDIRAIICFFLIYIITNFSHTLLRELLRPPSLKFFKTRFYYVTQLHVLFQINILFYLLLILLFVIL